MSIKKRKRKIFHVFILVLVLGCFSSSTPLWAQDSGGKVRVILETGNIRLKPNPESIIIKSVPIGSELTVESREGPWFLIKLPPDQNGFEITGYIHESAVQIVPGEIENQPQIQREAPVQTQDPELQREPTPRQQPRPYNRIRGIHPGLSLKFGWINSPDPGGFSNAWLAGVGFDVALHHHFTLGIEIQPAARSYPEIDLNRIPVMGFGNVKAGMNLGRLLRFLRTFNLYGGGGLGVYASYASLVYEGETYTNFRTDFAYHVLAGLELSLGGLRLFGEYQLVQVPDPNVEPNFWRHHLFFGIKF